MGEGTESEKQGIINFAMLPQGCAHSCTDENSCRSAGFSVFCRLSNAAFLCVAASVRGTALQFAHLRPGPLLCIVH